MAVCSIDELLKEGVDGRHVLVRSDFNVPLDGDKITDPGRIIAALPTLNALIDAGAKVIITAHLGRPKGEPGPKFSLAPVVARLGEGWQIEQFGSERHVTEGAGAHHQADIVLVARRSD